jgi:hypothetical protein
MRGKAILILNIVCLLAGSAVYISSSKWGTAGVSRMAPQASWVAALQFKHLTISASLP